MNKDCYFSLKSVCSLRTVKKNTGNSTAATQNQNNKGLHGHYVHSHSSMSSGFLNSHLPAVSGYLFHAVAEVSATVKKSELSWNISLPGYTQ